MHAALLDHTFPLPLDLPFTRQQALGAGITKHQLTRLLEDGLLRRVLHGVYAAAQAPDTQLFRALAIRLVVPVGCIVTDESAGWLAGADMVLRPGSHLATPPLTAFGTWGKGRLRNGLVDSGTRDLLPHDLTEIHGVWCTTPLRTALDLGRMRHRDRALAGLDQMLRLGTFTRDELLQELPRFKGMRGVRQLRVLAPIADGRSESPGESALRLRFHDACVPLPEPQREVHDENGRFIGRVDLMVEELRFIAEYNGERFHGEDRREYDASRLEALEDAGHTVVVFWKHHVFGQQQKAIEMIRQGIWDARSALHRRLGLAADEPSRRTSRG
jgi:hypothetical protein